MRLLKEEYLEKWSELKHKNYLNAPTSDNLNLYENAKKISEISYKNTLNNLFGGAYGSTIWAISYTAIQKANFLDGQDINSMALKTGLIVMASCSLSTVLNPVYGKTIQPLINDLGQRLDKATEQLTPSNIIKFIGVQSAKISNFIQK